MIADRDVDSTVPTQTTTGRIGRIAIGDIVRRAARRYPNATALVDGDVRVTFAELDESINRFAHFLLSRGLRKGDRVVMLSENSYKFVIAAFGTQKAGMVWVPVNIGLAPGDIEYIVAHCEPRLAYLGEAVYANPVLRELATRLARTVVAGTTPAQGEAIGFDEALAGQPGDEPDVPIYDRDLAQIMYTSGTTGRPKGVMHSHLALYIASFGNIIEGDQRPSDATAAILPLFHCAAHALLCSLLHIGAKTVILRGFDPVRVLETIETERLTFLFALPLMFTVMLDHPDRATRDLSSLRRCLYGMAPMPEPLLRRLIGEFCAEFSLASGQTEMYPGTTTFKPEEQLRRFGPYWGESSIVNDTAIMDDEGNLLPKGEIGEIVHRGANVMEGYYKDPEATAAARAFGWHHTGDLGTFDPDGQLLFVDRKKDMIKTGGENVPSIKVETVLLRHAAVANAVAAGIPHPRWSEAVTAFVLLKPGAAATEEELLAHCKEHLGGFEVPKAIRFVDRLPMTSTGKVQKQVLREEYRELYLAP